MLGFEQMIVRLLIALSLGALVGLERNLAGKEAGMRTEMLISGGASLFTIIALALPYLAAPSPEFVPQAVLNGTFVSVIANIVVGIGFLGAGIIIQTREHVRGLTTAAAVWATAAIGILAGLGLWQFGLAATLIIVVLLYLSRKLEVEEMLTQKTRDGFSQ